MEGKTIGACFLGKPTTWEGSEASSGPAGGGPERLRAWGRTGLGPKQHSDAPLYWRWELCSCLEVFRAPPQASLSLWT